MTNNITSTIITANITELKKKIIAKIFASY